MKGRKPLLYEVITAAGNRGKFGKAELEARQKNQPKIKSAALRCPKHMSAAAKKEWRRITRLYGELDSPIINDLDLNALEIYCEAVVTYQKAMNEVRETVEVYQASTGPKKNPWLAVANEAALLIKKYGEALLLDPVSRARVGLAKSKTDKPLTGIAKFMSDRNTGRYGNVDQSGATRIDQLK